MRVGEDFHQACKAKLTKLHTVREPYFALWKDLSDYFLPRRYVWLEDENSSSRVTNMRNQNILDSTGTQAARVLASGMMNGITSPARPWFNLRIAGNDDINMVHSVRVWLDEVTRRMLQTIAETNFYNSLAVLYVDLVVFGTGAAFIYEDYDSVFRMYNSALGEYYLTQDERLAVNGVARKFTYTVEQTVNRWGEDNVSKKVLNDWKKGGANTQNPVYIQHLIEPNNDGKGKVPKTFKYRETYWERNGTNGEVLGQSGFHELPGIFPRWELSANDAYGASPAMEALGDVIQLQFETKRKAQGIDKLVNPPLVVDSQLRNNPIAAIPGGITYVSGANNIGAKPLYTVAPPINEMSQDILAIQQRIRETFHNSLFLMISQLDTVRSASEIDARREEKLVLLGPVLERFENEALDPALSRIFNIMNRAGLFPPAPPEIQGAKLEVQYVSILSTAQSAVSAIPLERWLGFIGNLAAIRPDILEIPDWDGAVRDYGKNLGVSAKHMLDAEEVEAKREAQKAAAMEANAMAAAPSLAGAAEQLSNTEVGGGMNAIQAMLGG